MDDFRHVRIAALREVYRYHTFDPLEPEKCPPPSEEYQLRRVMRDVSRRFHVPLFEGSVQRVPIAELLQAHYEAVYEELAESTDLEAAHAWELELQRASETEEERIKREAAEREDRRGSDRLAEEIVAHNRRVDALAAAGGEAPREQPRAPAGPTLGAAAGAARAEVASWREGSNFPGGAGRDFDPMGGFSRKY